MQQITINHVSVVAIGVYNVCNGISSLWLQVDIVLIYFWHKGELYVWSLVRVIVAVNSRRVRGWGMAAGLVAVGIGELHSVW